MDPRNLEHQIAQSLKEYGFQFSQEWSIKTASQQRIYLDFYINFPIRAFVEIKQAGPKNLTHGMIERAANFIQSVYSHFNGQILPIIVADKKANQRLQQLIADTPVLFIDLMQDNPSAGHLVARSIRNSVVHLQNPVVEKYFSHRDPGFDFNVSKTELPALQEKVGERLRHVVASFRPLLSKEQYTTLEEEISQFHKEVEAKHYTPAALRVGRTVEYIFYALSIEWEVKINKTTIETVNALRNLFNELEKQLIDYINAETEEKDNLRSKLEKQKNIILRKINALMSKVDEQQINEKTQPLNVQSLVRDIKKKFKENKQILDEVNLIIENDLISNILKKRNQAAHANTSGVRQEFERSDLNAMIDDLCTILFHLCNIASLVQKFR